MPCTSKALIDADIILYRVGFACQHTDYKVYIKGEESAGVLAQFPNKTELNKWLKEQEGDFVQEYIWTSRTWTEPVSYAVHSAKLMIENILEKVHATEYVCYLTGSNNYRLDVLPSYKAGRPPRPILYDKVREYLINHWAAVVCDGIEADDSLGIEQTEQTDTIICSIDKDLLNIPGEHYNFVTDTFTTISEEEGSLRFDRQMLTGDSVDNICGIKGLGPKTAEKLLDQKNAAERTQIIQDKYKEYWEDGWLEVYKCNSELLWILREERNETKS